MKEYIWGIIGTVVALLTLVIQFIKALKENRQERKAREQEQRNHLLLKLCDQVEYYNGIYRIKFINKSVTASAYNLKASIRIKNQRYNYTYKVPDFSSQEDIMSSLKEEDKSLCEIYVKINVMDIDEKEIFENASPEIKNLYFEKKLELKDLLNDKENYLAVRYNAVNKATGRTEEFERHVFRDSNIVYGRYGIGNDFVTPLD